MKDCCLDDFGVSNLLVGWDDEVSCLCIAVHTSRFARSFPAGSTLNSVGTNELNGRHAKQFPRCPDLEVVKNDTHGRRSRETISTFASKRGRPQE